MDFEKYSKHALVSAGFVAILAVAGVSNAFSRPDGAPSEGHYAGKKEKIDRYFSFTLDTDDYAGGDQVEESRDLEGYTKIKLKGAAELHVSQGAFSFRVKAPQAALDKIDISVKNGQLVLDTKRVGKRSNGGDGIDFYISLPNLEAFELRGAGEAHFEKLDVKDLAIDISGAGDLEFEGRCDTVTFDIAGAANLEAGDLKCHKADVSLSGAGDLTVYADEAVRVKLGGVGHVKVLGSPKERDTRSGGIGSIEID